MTDIFLLLIFIQPARKVRFRLLFDFKFPSKVSLPVTEVWSPSEDDLLRNLVSIHGTKDCNSNEYYSYDLFLKDWL